jgi:membrane protein
MRADQAGEHGHYAKRPLAIPIRGWGNVTRRVFAELSEDNLSIVAAGVAFYGVLAVFPQSRPSSRSTV